MTSRASREKRKVRSEKGWLIMFASKRQLSSDILGAAKYANAEYEIKNSLQAALFELKVIYSHTALIFDHP